MNTRRFLALAAAVVACASTMALTGTAQAQQSNQCNQQGCYAMVPSGRTVFLYSDGRVLDTSTNFVFKPTQNGVMAFSNRGWLPIASVQNASQVWAAIQGPHTVPVGPMPGPVWSSPGTGVSSGSSGGWHTPDCRNQRGAPCPGVYDPTPHGDVNTSRDFNRNNRPGNR